VPADASEDDEGEEEEEEEEEDSPDPPEPPEPPDPPEPPPPEPSEVVVGCGSGGGGGCVVDEIGSGPVSVESAVCAPAAGTRNATAIPAAARHADAKHASTTRAGRDDLGTRTGLRRTFNFTPGNHLAYVSSDQASTEYTCR
jgi:hypothetical protein